MYSEDVAEHQVSGFPYFEDHQPFVDCPSLQHNLHDNIIAAAARENG
jgi:hypothetical protein